MLDHLNDQCLNDNHLSIKISIAIIIHIFLFLFLSFFRTVASGGGGSYLGLSLGGGRSGFLVDFFYDERLLDCM